MMLQVDNASLFYETAGQGSPILFIHAGVADSRQWNNEFTRFAQRHEVIRYDMRGFGKSDPVAGEFSHLSDLNHLISHLDIQTPLILIGCSMGGGTALDYTLQKPDKVRALILVDSAPSGLELDIPAPPKFKLVDEAEEAGDLELVSEIETQIWFDGGRESKTVDQKMRQLVFEMNLIALQNDEKELGTRQQNTSSPAIDKLTELEVPVLALVGEYDIPYMHEAVKIMAEKIQDYRCIHIPDAAHLPNMDQPERFEEVVRGFIESVS